jgi:EAL domain-containing protein (putative c-di-GMP-specific phosphodiesterase class I)
MKTIAEGVETEAQLTALEALGCDAAQGFFFSRAVPPAEVAAAMASIPAARTSSESLTRLVP